MILTGFARLGRAAVLRYTPDGTPVLNLALAYSHGQKQADGNRATQWVEAALFGKRAESLAPHLLKGTPLDVVIEDAHIEYWQDRDGARRDKLVGRVLSLEFAGRAPSAEAAPSDARPAAAAAALPTAAGVDDFEDVPF